MLICPNKDFDDPNTRPRLWWVGYLDPQRLQQQSDSAAAPAGSAAFYDAGAEVIRYVLGRRTLDALQGWTITGAPGTGCGGKYRRERVQPLTRGAEANETKTVTVARPLHARVPLSRWQQQRATRST